MSRTHSTVTKLFAAVGFLLIAGNVWPQSTKPVRVDPGTHLGVRASQLVMVFHDFAASGWRIQASDGSIRPFSVPGGQVLIITDFHSESWTGFPDAGIFLSIEQPGIEGSRRHVYTYRSTNGGFEDAVHDQMTTGFTIPAGWVLLPPTGIAFGEDIFIKMYGYFTAAQ